VSVALALFLRHFLSVFYSRISFFLAVHFDSLRTVQVRPTLQRKKEKETENSDASNAVKGTQKEEELYK
jgi:hypothetical protein